MAAPDLPPAIFLPLIISAGLTVCNVIVHALAVLGVVRFVRRERRRGIAGVRFWRDVIIVTAAVVTVSIAHLLEIATWGVGFALCGEFHGLASAFYHSAENYTTLGYGDVVMSPSWKLLGPLEAGDGMLMFGISTAVIFSVVQLLVQTRLGDPSQARRSRADA